jgi:hypothetical protein
MAVRYTAEVGYEAHHHGFNVTVRGGKEGFPRHQVWHEFGATAEGVAQIVTHYGIAKNDVVIRNPQA